MQCGRCIACTTNGAESGRLVGGAGKKLYDIKSGKEKSQGALVGLEAQSGRGN